jgi:hypothetical protein
MTRKNTKTTKTTNLGLTPGEIGIATARAQARRAMIRPDADLARIAQHLIDALGDETACAMAAKLVVIYGHHPADRLSARLGDALYEALPNSGRDLDVL